MEIRSFLAFELPTDIMSVIVRVSKDLRKTTLDVRWVKEINIHLTMIFLGNIQTEDIEPIKEAGRKICTSYGPFSVFLSGMGCFPHSRNPRVLWLGLEGDLGRLSGFRNALQEPLAPFGVREEKRPFRPHLTLGRFRKQGDKRGLLEDVLEKYQDLKSPECVLDRLTFFKSTLKPGGAVYTKLASWPVEGKR